MSNDLAAERLPSLKARGGLAVPDPPYRVSPKNETPKQERSAAAPAPSIPDAADDRTAGAEARSIDDFLEEAYLASSPPRSSPSAILGALSDRRRYWASILSLGVALSSDSSEVMYLSYVLSDSDFETDMLGGDVAGVGGLLAGSVFLGMLLGGLGVGAAADRWGRRSTLLVGLTSNAAAGALSALAPGAAALAALRFAVGVGVGATTPPLFALAAEISPPSRRGFIVTVVASFCMVGPVYVSLLAMLAFRVLGWGWRAFAALCAAPSALGAAFVLAAAPKSPRFLAIGGGGHAEAADAANEIARRMGALPPPPPPLELALGGPVPRGRGGVGRIRPLGVEEVRWHYPRWRYPRRGDDGRPAGLPAILREALGDFTSGTAKVYSPHLRSGATVPLQIVWFSLSFASYGIDTWINSIFVRVHLRDVYFNALLFALASLPGNVLSTVLVEPVGRRATLTVFMALAAACLVSFAWYARDPQQGGEASTPGIVLSACAFKASSLVGWNALLAMTGETFPTSVRGAGTGICAATEGGGPGGAAG